MRGLLGIKTMINDLIDNIKKFIFNCSRIKKANTLNPRNFDGRLQSAYLTLLQETMDLANKIKADFIQSTFLESTINDINTAIDEYYRSGAWRDFSNTVTTAVKMGDPIMFYEALRNYQITLYEYLKPCGAVLNVNASQAVDNAFLTHTQERTQ